jgi:hypothetical protein
MAEFGEIDEEEELYLYVDMG